MLRALSLMDPERTRIFRTSYLGGMSLFPWWLHIDNHVVSTTVQTNDTPLLFMPTVRCCQWDPDPCEGRCHTSLLALRVQTVRVKPLVSSSQCSPFLMHSEYNDSECLYHNYFWFPHFGGNGYISGPWCMVSLKP